MLAQDVGLADDAHTPPVVIDHRKAGDAMLHDERHRRLDGLLGGDRQHVARHDI